jgi:hypothetical protein
VILFALIPLLPVSEDLRSHRKVDVLVIGAGPTGLGAAKRLNQLVRFDIEHPAGQYIMEINCQGRGLTVRIWDCPAARTPSELSSPCQIVLAALNPELARIFAWYE